jgi:DNA primase catalytic core
MPQSAERSRTIPDAVIASVKTNTSFLSLLKSYGTEAKKAGSGYKAICPFHDVDGHPENTASLSVDPTTNLYHCFSCNAQGNVIQFVMGMEKVTFPEAVEKLLAVKGARVGSKREEAVKEEKKDAVPLPEDQRQVILSEVLARCTQALRNDAAARKYLESRGLDALRLIESFELGYWPHGLYGDLQSGERKKLSSVGLATNGCDLFDQCIIAPFRKDGRITTIYGRRITTPSDADMGRHYLLPHRREGLFLPTVGLDPRAPVIITESVIDGLSLFTAGVTNVLPLLGVNGFLADHLEYLKAQRFPMIHIALNGDDAGNRAAAALKQKLDAEKLAAEIIELPAGKDFNDMLREMGDNGLRDWITQRVGASKSAPATVWEDEAGATYALFADREYRIPTLPTYGMDQLRVSLKLYRVSDKQRFYLDKLDLYLARAREHFITHAAKTLDVEPQVITDDVNALITVLEELRLRKKEEDAKPKVYHLSPEEAAAAMEYLCAPNLLERIAADFEACGMVGNRNNCIIAFLVSISRLLEKPLGALTISRSGAGKSFMQDLIGRFAPDEGLCKITRLTGQSLFYKGKAGIKHKTLIIEEDEGMKDAMFAIRVLLSSQRLNLESVRHDQKSGEMRDFTNVVEGPVSVLIAGTDKAAFDDETANRFFTLYLDESREQTQRILAHQDRMDSAEGLEIRARQKIIAKLHQNVQRLLQPLQVVNPIGTGIKYPPEILHCRREKTKIQTLIKAVALLHQHQREVKEKDVLGSVVKYIEVAQSDVDAVKEIAGEILRHSLDDLSQLCRDLLHHIHDLVEEKFVAARKEEAHLERWQVAFARKELMDRTRWSRWHLEEHLRELEQAGYIASRMGKRGQKFSYCLVIETIPELPDIG